MKILLMIYPVGLFALTFFGCKYAGKGKFCDNLWDRQQTKMLQAFACLAVIIHHVTQLITGYGVMDYGPITLFHSMGIMFTSVFFFCSGYGLIVSVTQKPDYLDGFLIHRLPLILVPFFMANVISVLIRLFYLKIPTTLPNIVKAVFGLVLLNGNGWFLVEIFFLYLAFYLSFLFIKNKDIAIAVLCMAAFFIIGIGYNNGHDTSVVGDHWFMGEWWYNATIVFVMGILVARFRERIVHFVKKHYTIILSVTSVLLLISFVAETYVRNTRGYYKESFAVTFGLSNKGATLLAQMVLCLIFMWFVLLINMKVSIGNRALAFIGSISMEIFLLHGLFVRQIFSFKNVNVFWIYAIVTVCGIVSACILYLIDRPVIVLIQSLGMPKDYIKDCQADLLREKRMRKRRHVKNAILIGIMALFVGYFSMEAYIRLIQAPMECKQELNALAAAQVGDEVFFGRYESDLIRPGRERVSWIVLEKQGNQYMLVSKKGLAGSVYAPKHEKVGWEQSGLREMLNETMYYELFRTQEQQYIVPNPASGDMLSLLSAGQAELYFDSDEARQLALTNAATSYGTNVNVMSKANNWDNKGYRSSWWWLRGVERALTAPIVSVDGTILMDEKYVNKPNGAVRPVVYVELP